MRILIVALILAGCGQVNQTAPNYKPTAGTPAPSGSTAGPLYPSIPPPTATPYPTATPAHGDVYGNPCMFGCQPGGGYIQ